MGRLLKRVPLDFNWPIEQNWKGYVNPYHSQSCKNCEGGGYNKETTQLGKDWYAFENENYKPNPKMCALPPLEICELIFYIPLLPLLNFRKVAVCRLSENVLVLVVLLFHFP